MGTSRTPSHATAVNRIRVSYWYWRLRRASGLSDKDLNRLLRPDLDPEDAKESKTFERIRVDKSIPSRGARRMDGLDIVAAMEQHFPGTQYWYEAPMWGLVAEPADDLAEASARVESLSKELGLRRATRAELVEVSATCNERIAYSRLTGAMLAGMDRLDSVAVLAALYREAELAVQHGVLHELELMLDRHIDILFFDAGDVEIAQGLYLDLLTAILQAPRPSGAAVRGGSFSSPIVQLPLVSVISI